MEVATTADSVLDLCVRKREREDYDDNDNEVEIDVKYDINSITSVNSDDSKDDCDMKPPLLLRQQLHQPLLAHPDATHSAIMAHLQERIYADEKLHSPPYISVSPSSSGSISDTSHISPTAISSLSRAMGNGTPMRDGHRGPNYFSDLPPSSISYPYPVHLSPPCVTLPRAIVNATKGKATRPFKAYTKETLLASADKNYEEFRAQVLAQSKDANLNKNGNKNMKRPVQSTSPHQVPSSSGDFKDQAYWEKRRKNNEAAKRSRDARRAKEDELAIRVAYLQNENISLRAQIHALTMQLEKVSQKGHQTIYAS